MYSSLSVSVKTNGYLCNFVNYARTHTQKSSRKVAPRTASKHGGWRWVTRMTEINIYSIQFYESFDIVTVSPATVHARHVSVNVFIYHETYFRNSHTNIVSLRWRRRTAAWSGSRVCIFCPSEKKNGKNKRLLWYYTTF